MSDNEWKNVGLAMLSKSRNALNICIKDEWYMIKVYDLRDIMEGVKKYAKVTTPPRIQVLSDKP